MSVIFAICTITGAIVWAGLLLIFILKMLEGMAAGGGR